MYSTPTSTHVRAISIMASRRVPIGVRPQPWDELDKLTATDVIAPVDELTPWIRQVIVVRMKSGDLQWARTN